MAEGRLQADIDALTATMRGIASDIDRYLKDTMRDPDILAKTNDWRDGYERGFREASVAYVSILVQRKS